MELVTTEEMRLLEKRAEEEYGLSPRVLMENAGRAAFDLAQEILAGSPAGKRVLICAGKGNNGGDALVLARYLVNAGAQVVVALASSRDSLQGPALEAFKAAAKMAEEVETLRILECAGPDWKRDLAAVRPVDLAVDGLLGTGLKGAISGTIKELVQFINELACPCLALDIPTGILADTGQIETAGEEELGCFAVCADYTITFGRPKVGLFCYPAPDFVGELRVSSIGIPDSLVAKTGLEHFWLRPEMVKRALPTRPNSGHKGTFGHVLTVGGSLGLTGAPCLAAEAALRAGCGKSTLAGPSGLNHIFETKLTEVMTLPLPETADHSIAVEAQYTLAPRLQEYDVILVGPGLSLHPETAVFLSDFLQAVEGQLVLDADALNIMAIKKERFQSLLKELPRVPIITPHPGEMARLLGITTGEAQKRRVAVAKEAAVQWGSVVVLKGANTVIATPAGVVYINTTGDSGLATAGTGDVLAGMIAGFLAQGAGPLEAALCGTFFHGLAGERARAAGYGAGLIAGDLLKFLPAVLNEYYRPTRPTRK